MSNDLMVTVVGWAATTPREMVGERVTFTSFRLATTPRYFDSKVGTWTDRRTEWITVKAFRDVAFNVAASVHKGDPMVVHGRLRTEEWAGEGGVRTTLVLDAVALGHDLSRGTARFARTVRVAAIDPESAEPLLEDGVGSEPGGAPTDGAVEAEVPDAAADGQGGSGAGADDADLAAALAGDPWAIEPEVAGARDR